MYKRIVHIKGMHCRSCEILIEDELNKIPGVYKVMVSHKKGIAELDYEGHIYDKSIEQAVTEAGYELGKDEKPWFSGKPKDYKDLFKALGILLIIYLVADNLGIFNFNVSSGGNFSNLSIVFLIGLTAGISTCMALVGGLVLGASARFVEKHPTASSLQKFKPHLFFNLGRIIAFFILGGLIGMAGSFFQLSTTALGFLTIIVGLVMLLLGLQLTEISPKIRSFSFTLPKGVSRALGIKEQNEKEYSHKNSFILGAMTFFLPCGFTQAMQLYAISSGSFWTGALTMGVFAVGTAPGLLGIGGLTSIVKGAFARLFFKFAGLVVIFLALFNLSNGYNLAGLNLWILSVDNEVEAVVEDPNVIFANGVQIVNMAQSSHGYSPNSFTIKKDIPVKWVVTSKDINTCASSIVSSKLGVRGGLQLGENIIEFTPKEVGKFKFSCLMGMYTGTFNVVEAAGITPIPTSSSNLVPTVKPTVTPTPTAVINPAEVQLLKATYTQEEDIQPSKFTVNVGKPVRLEIDVKEDGYGCMGSMALPGLSNKVDLLTKGQPLIYNFTPQKAGQYYLTCGMGVPRGTITVK